MKSWNLNLFALVIVFVTLWSVGCTKKVAKVQPPAAPPLQTPTATLAANPSTIQQGQPTTLTWQTNNASDITIAGLGTLSTSGSKVVTPGASTTYTLVARGAGGTGEASARVTVNMPVAAAPQASGPSDQDLFAKNVKDVLFDYDKFSIRSNETPDVQADASFLKGHPNAKVMIEGHCDDRGSEEYNLALGTSRAESVKHALLQQGISPQQIKTISYGKEKPLCNQDNEQCWQQNRVDHFVYQR